METFAECGCETDSGYCLVSYRGSEGSSPCRPCHTESSSMAVVLNVNKRRGCSRLSGRRHIWRDVCVVFCYGLVLDLAAGTATANESPVISYGTGKCLVSPSVGCRLRVALYCVSDNQFKYPVTDRWKCTVADNVHGDSSLIHQSRVSSMSLNVVLTCIILYQVNCF